MSSVIYDVAVVTGLEKLAVGECQKRLKDFQLHTQTVGHVFFKTSSSFEEIAKLHSVDNIYVLVYRDYVEDLPKANTEKLEELFQQVITEAKWQNGIQVWMEASGFAKGDTGDILDRSEDTSGKPSFRVSCNRNGDHKFASPEACSIFGGIVNDVFHWPVSLKQFDLEVLLTIKQDLLSIGLCLTKESLYKRYIVSYGVTTLRGTIAFNLLQVADIQPGELVCDPLCGTAVIPIECSQSWPHTFVLCGDHHEVALEKSLENCTANKLNQTDILSWDTTRLPLKTGLVDVFATDLPFGKRIGTRTMNKVLYPAVLAEMIRCVAPATGRIVLLTQDKTSANQCFRSQQVKKYCHLLKSIYVKVGGLDSSIYLLKRNKNPYE